VNPLFREEAIAASSYEGVSAPVAIRTSTPLVHFAVAILAMVICVLGALTAVRFESHTQLQGIVIREPRSVNCSGGDEISVTSTLAEEDVRGILNASRASVSYLGPSSEAIGLATLDKLSKTDHRYKATFSIRLLRPVRVPDGAPVIVTLTGRVTTVSEIIWGEDDGG